LVPQQVADRTLHRANKSQNAFQQLDYPCKFLLYNSLPEKCGKTSQLVKELISKEWDSLNQSHVVNIQDFHLKNYNT